MTSPGRKPQERKVPVRRVDTRRLAARIAVFFVAQPPSQEQPSVFAAIIAIVANYIVAFIAFRHLPSLPPRREDVTPERH